MDRWYEIKGSVSITITAIIRVNVGKCVEINGSVSITITAIIKVTVGRRYEICEYYIRDTLVCCF